MMQKIRIRVDAEDNLLIAVARRLLAEFGDKYEIIGEPQKHPATKGGIEKDVLAWNRAAGAGVARFVLMDMDSLASPQNKHKCPDSEIQRLLRKEPKSPNLLFRIAVFESESWLLADWGRLRKFLKMESVDFTEDVDEIEDSKEYLHGIIRRESPPGERMRIDKRLRDFAQTKWRPYTAAKNSKSLQQTLQRLKEYRPEMSE